MATQSALSLATDPSKINPAGASQEDLTEYQKSLDAQIKSLEDRYAQPNYFKVAAGFLKPQLGGFFASVGSASEALGENVEQQRAAALPIAQMRSQLAQSKILTGQNKTVADMVAEYQASGKPLTPEFVAEVNRIAPDSPSAKALVAQLAAAQKQRELASSEQGNAINRVNLARQMGVPPNPADLALLASASPTTPNQVTKTPKDVTTETTATTTTPSPSTLSEQDTKKFTEELSRLQRDKEALTREMGRKQSPSGMATLQDEMVKLNQREAELTSKLSGTSKPIPTVETAKSEGKDYLPTLVRAPSISQVTDPEQKRIQAAKYEAEVKSYEEPSALRYTNLKNLVANEQLPLVTSSTKSALTMMEDFPELSNKVLNLVRNSSPLLAALNEGISFQMSSTAGAFGGAAAIPVSAYLKAQLSPTEQTFADELINKLANLQAYSLRLSSVSPTALVNHPTGMAAMKSFNFSADQTPEALYNTVKHFQFNTDFLQRYYKMYEDELMRTHPDSLTKKTDAFRSPKLQELSDAYSEIHLKYDRDYNKRRFGKTKP
jgi:hypothetical protein